jgi:hypothetical protein
MPIEVRIADGLGGSSHAHVNGAGVVAVGPLDYSKSYNATAAVANTAYNLIEPKAGQIFVVTAILLYANKNVGVNDATVELYEADAIDTTTVFRSVLQTEMPQKTTRDLTGLNLQISAGKWLNVKTDDDDIFCTVLGYYSPLIAG